MSQEIISKCRILLQAFKDGKLGYMKMPEDSHPEFDNEEARLVYFTLPMSLNYQRNSYTLWESALKTYNDPETKVVFNVNFNSERLREYLMKYKVALQPNKHIDTWSRIVNTIYSNWGSIGNLFKFVDYDFLKLKELIQVIHKKGFPYLSGPKIFHYWSFIIQEYGGVKLKNSEFIEIAPDTHVTKCSIKLGVIDDENLSKEEISKKWREVLKGSGISPIDMHSPLWFWSRNGFEFRL